MIRYLLISILVVALLVVPISAAGINGELDGGYYFVVDCSLGSGVKFYVPNEWGRGVFTLDSYGDLVNMSSSTCYAYSPDYPDVTFSASRLNTFIYRNGTNTIDLEVREIIDTNITLLRVDSVYLSDKEIFLLIAALMFIACALIIIRRA